MVFPKNFWWYVVSIGFLSVYGLGLFIDIMDVDAAQYASITLEMLSTNSFLIVKERGIDYLDKPPLLFWLGSFSFYCFGLSNVAYKLPSLLFTLLGFYSTHRFAKLFYNGKVSILSVLVLASCFAMVLINNDVRTDTILMGSVIFSLWQIAAWNNTRNAIYLIGTGVGIGLAMLAKGPIGLVVPILAFGADWLYRRQWSHIFQWQWLLVLPIIVLLLAPMLYGLYLQYGYDGWLFYFWSQSFGRVTGHNQFIQTEKGRFVNDPSFFVHTTLWAFLPWTPFLLIGIWQDAKAIWTNRLKPIAMETVTLFGFLFVMLALTFSSYKLPHYIFVVYPLAAIVTAKVLSQYRFQRFVLPISLITIVVYLFLNGWLYPQSMQLQATTRVGKQIADKAIPLNKFYTYRAKAHSLDFYAQRTVPEFSSLDELSKKIKPGSYLFTDRQGFSEIAQLALKPIAVDSMYHVRGTNALQTYLFPKEPKDCNRFLVKF